MCSEVGTPILLRQTNMAFCLGITLIVFSFALSGCITANATQPSLEKRAQNIHQRLMCPICPGETIDQSQVELANQIRTVVREKLAQGESDQEILQFFVERYGARVLAEPPRRGFNLVGWVVPPSGIIIGAILIFLATRGMRLRKREKSAMPPDNRIDLGLAHYLERVDKELEEDIYRT